MQVAINECVIGKPKTKKHHFDLTYKCENLDVTAKELSTLIQRGFTFCAQHKNNHRKAANFTRSGFIAVDIDKGSTISDILGEEFIKQYCSFIYTTENHTPEFNRFRIVFELENPITESTVMRNALTGILQKFGGDVSCKDATRLFYGSKGCEIHWTGKILPDDVLAEIIILGEESGSAKNIQESSNDKTRTTIQSRSLLDIDTVVRTQDGEVKKITEIPPNTKVCCPVHLPDNNASAFTLLSKSGVAGIHCSTCQKTYFTSATPPIFDFNYGLTNLKHHSETNVLITDEDGFFTYEDSMVKRFSEKYLPRIETFTPIVFVKSPKGSGKTEWLVEIVKQYRENHQTVLLIGHRRSLITSVAKRLGLKSYLNPGYFDKATKHLAEEQFVTPHGGYAICADSLSTLLNPQIHKYDVVLIDEVEQVFSHLTASTLKYRRNDTVQYFKHYVNMAKKVYVTDADLNYLSIDAIYQFLTEKQKKVTFLINDYVPESKSLYVYGGSEHLTKHLVDSIDNGKRVFVCANSKRKIKQLAGYFDTKYGDTKKVFSITSSNSQENDSQYFIENIKEEILNYDVVLVSPSVGTGVDISFPNNSQEIDCVYGFFEARINTHFDIDQQLSRVRHPKEIRVWVSPEQFRFETSIDVIKREIGLTDRAAKKLLHIEDNGTCVYDSPDDAYLNIYADVKSLERGSKNNLKKQFISMKKHYGWEIINVELDKEKSTEGAEVISVAKEIQEQVRVQSIMQAKLVTKDEYIALHKASDKLPLTEFHLSAMRRYEIESFYYTDVTKELIEKDKDGKLRYQIRAYEDYVTEDSILMAKDFTEIDVLNRHITDKKTLLARKRFFQELFVLAGLLNDDKSFNTDKVITNDEMAQCVKYMTSHSTKIQRWFEISLRKDYKTKPIQQIGVFLKMFGITWKRTEKKRSDGGKDYFYNIRSENVEYLNETVALRNNPEHTEKWHSDRNAVADNRLFNDSWETRSLIKRQIRAQKINPNNKSDDW